MSALPGRSLLRAGRPLLVLAATATGTGGSVAIALSAGVPQRPATPPLAGIGTPPAMAAAPAPADSVEASLAGAFALLRRPQHAGEALPASVPVAFSGVSGANVALARRVDGAEGEQVWVIPGRGSVCILAQMPSHGPGGAVCSPVVGARRGELDVQSASTRVPGAELLAGVVPDGVTDVTLHLADGTMAGVTVRENVYVGLVHGSVATIDASTPQGRVRIPSLSALTASGIPMPAR